MTLSVSRDLCAMPFWEKTISGDVGRIDDLVAGDLGVLARDAEPVRPRPDDPAAVQQPGPVARRVAVDEVVVELVVDAPVAGVATAQRRGFVPPAALVRRSWPTRVPVPPSVCTL